MTTQRRRQKLIIQRLRTDLHVGRSAGVITAIQLMWLNRITRFEHL